MLDSAHRKKKAGMADAIPAFFGPSGETRLHFCLEAEIIDIDC